MLSIDIDAAIAAHKAWRGHLRYFLDDISNKTFTIESARDHTACALGQWLYGPGANYSLFTQYSDLMEVHRLFHETAAEITRLHQAGDNERAETMLAEEFTVYSHRVIELLELLKI